VLDKYTHPNIFIAKHNGDDKLQDYKDKELVPGSVAYFVWSERIYGRQKYVVSRVW